jgi:hypothetical protein
MADTVTFEKESFVDKVIYFHEPVEVPLFSVFATIRSYLDSAEFIIYGDALSEFINLL